ncbi:polynucleotide kinase-phosphatase [Acrocarpospora macrocephala]|uniref:Polynucleotide kinase-phosphatase n=1 Tax=Acrocarpospora macrocephala TaxID=150177 RepID=A0A5M3X545_9ACTN|nr:polynucleotide kinase-phosphatase [Acrocarpospora macrocephala]GES13278.1 polynucleotide kinase-phosphatase [Acrocarpospora macrocephala]
MSDKTLNEQPTPRQIGVPAMSLIVLVGVSGSGKSTFARKHFHPTQVISSDFCRGLVADDENDQSATPDAFDVLHYIVGTRLRRGLLTVVDATSVQFQARQQLVELAKAHNVLVDAIVLDVPEEVAIERNSTRPDRDFGPHVITRQRKDLRRSLGKISRDGFRRVHVLRGDEIDNVTITLEPAWTDLKHLTGPFDIIGDVHGCAAELETLLTTLGYVDGRHPQGRTAVFVGDLVDRGPDTPGVLRRVMGMVEAGTALCVCGNHEQKLVRALNGRKVRVAHGLEESLTQLAEADPAFVAAAKTFMDGLISHYQLDDGKLVVAHAGLKEPFHGRASARVRAFALYGDTTGETDEYGLPVRYPWAEDYRGRAMVVYGHTPTTEPEWINNTICLDTGVVFGGRLTALRYPERELISVPAERVWYEPTRPLAPARQRDPAALDIGDVRGNRFVETRFAGTIRVREENAAAALEIMSRFAVDPRWLVYLPPTMAPPETSQLDGYLEHPAEAFAEFAAAGVTRVVCEEKHMGSRAVAVLARTPEAAEKRFGVADGSTGMVYTRTGRPFFDTLTTELVDGLRAAVAPLWAELGTDWLVLDGELLPWSAKAESLIRSQYASVGAAARTALPEVVTALEAAAGRGLDVGLTLDRARRRLDNAARFRDAYARYCWPVSGLEGVRFAPFQILAAEGRATAVRHPHDWHLDQLARIDAPLVQPTRHVYVDLGSVESRQHAVDWWEELTSAGGEGMVVKPVERPEGRVQPGVKVRGREYLRIIYGPDYTESLDVLRRRFLGRKRSLALREHALGLEALARLADGEPLWRVHEPVFAVLAMESEPVDPRL